MQIKIGHGWMRFCFDTPCFFLEFSLGVSKECPFYDDYGEVQNIAEINFHFYLTLPRFKPDHQHIQWVKAAYGLTHQKTLAQQIDEDYDPLPF